MTMATKMSPASTELKTGITPTTCPTCGYKLDAASHLEDQTVRPSPGDFTVCFNCAGLLRFDEDCQPVSTVATDLLDLNPHDRRMIMKTRAAVTAFGLSRRKAVS